MGHDIALFDITYKGKSQIEFNSILYQPIYSTKLFIEDKRKCILFFLSTLMHAISNITNACMQQKEETSPC